MGRGGEIIFSEVLNMSFGMFYKLLTIKKLIQMQWVANFLLSGLY